LGRSRIHGELLKLGFDVSERTVSRWVQRVPKNPEPARRWQAFLQNHREAIAAMDFFTVPTFTFGVLYCFFVIAHDRRRILHCNVTRHPTGLWITQQLREAFPYDSRHKYLILDRDSKFGEAVSDAVDCIGLKAVRTSFRSPWQNGVAERWVASCRRDLLDQVDLQIQPWNAPTKCPVNGALSVLARDNAFTFGEAQRDTGLGWLQISNRIIA
jgi:transposase InsO family protein